MKILKYLNDIYMINFYIKKRICYSILQFDGITKLLIKDPLSRFTFYFNYYLLNFN